MEKKRLEYVGVVSFWLGIASYLLLRAWLWFPVIGFALAILGLCLYDTTKHRAKWYAIAGIFVNLISFVLGLRDMYS